MQVWKAISVGSVQSNGLNPQLSSFSSYVNTSKMYKPEFVADGVGIHVSSGSGSDVVSGTSFSTPAVSSAVAQVQNHYYSKHGKYLKSATVKALLAHSSQEAGSYPGPELPTGYGVPNVEAAIRHIDESAQPGMTAYARILEDGTIKNKWENRWFYSTGVHPTVATLAFTDLEGGDITSDPIVAKHHFQIYDRVNKKYYYPWRVNTTDSEGPSTLGNNFDNNLLKIEAGVLPKGWHYCFFVKL